MVTKTDFLLARIDEDETEARALLRRAQEHELHCQEPRLLGREIPGWHDWPKAQALAAKALADCEAKRAIVRLHESWPVLAERPPTIDAVQTTTGLTVRMSQQMAWLTEQEYRERFGIEPPTAPMVAALLVGYAEHPDYDEAW
jgi:hypothetical protein